MSVGFHDLPIEIYAEKMIPELDLMGAVSWSLASKVWLKIFQSISAAPDFNLVGGDVTYVFGEGDERPKSLFLSKVKWLKFSIHEEFSESLAKINVFVLSTNDHIQAICSHAFAKKDPSLMSAIVIFDYTTKRLNGTNLYSALEIAGEFDSELAKAVIIHPNANKIPGSALLKPLVGAINARDQGLVKLFLAHPESHKLEGKELLKPIIATIQVNETQLALQLLARPKAQNFGSTHLAKMLEAAIYANNQPLIVAILGLPKMKEVLATELFGPLIAAIKTNNREVITWGVGHPSVTQIRENDLQLPDAITAAIEVNNQGVLQMLLNLPNAQHMQGYMLVHPLMTAIQTKNQGLIQMILKHPRLNEMDPNSLSTLIKVAIQENNPGVLQTLLDIPSAAQIPARRPYFGTNFEDLSDEVDLMDDPALTKLFCSHPVVRRVLDAEVEEVEQENEEIDQAELVRDDNDIEDPNAAFEENQEDSDSDEDQTQRQNM